MRINMPPEKSLATLAAVLLIVSSMGGIASAGTTADAAAVDTTAAQSDDGFDEDDLETHDEQLEDAGSFNATVTINSSSERSSYQSTIEYAIDLDDDEEYSKTTSNSSFSDSTSVSYTFNNTSYTKRTYGSGDPTYSVIDEEESALGYSSDVVNATLAKGSRYVPADADFEQAGTTTVDGVSVTKYTASGDDVTESEAFATDYNSYKNGSATLYVDDDGLIRKYELSLVQESSYSNSTTNISLTYEVTEVGGVSIDEPGWLDEAEEAEEEEDDYYEQPEDCGTPELGGEFSYEENPDGTYDVTFNATETTNVSSVQIYVEGKQFEKSDYIYVSDYYDSETEGSLNDVAPESTVEAVAENDCGDEDELTETLPDGEVVDLTDDGPITSESIETHEGAVKDAGSFNSTITINRTTESNYGDDSYEYTQQYAIDLDNDEEYRQRTSAYYGSESVATAYTANGTTYEKSQYGDGDPYYSVTEEDDYYSYDVINASRAMGVSLLSADAGYEEAGTTTLDGETVTKYTASGEQLVEADAFDNGWTEYENGTSTLYIDDEGIVRKHELTLVRESSYSNATTTTTTTFEVTQVGGVSIQEPDWTDDAEEAEEERSYYDEDDGEPKLEGTFTTEEDDDGTYDVTFEPTTMENVSYVEVSVEDDESKSEYLWDTDDDARLVSVDPGSTVVAEAYSDGGDSTELNTTLPEGTVEPDTGPINESTVDTHEGALEDAGSFNATVTTTYSSNGSYSEESTTTSTTTYAIDLDADREYAKDVWSSEYSNSTSESYTLDGTSYTKSSYGEKSYYYVNNETDSYYSYDTINATEAMGVGHFAPGADYEEAGTTTLDGETVTKYVASGEDLTDSETMQERLYANEYENATSTLYVDDEGIIRKQELTYTTVSERTDTESTTTLTYEVTQVGGVEIDDPDWLGEAKESQDEKDY